MPGLHRGDDSTKTDFSGFSLFVCLVEQNTNIPYICVCCLLRQDFLLVCLFVQMGYNPGHACLYAHLFKKTLDFKVREDLLEHLWFPLSVVPSVVRNKNSRNLSFFFFRL